MDKYNKSKLKMDYSPLFFLMFLGDFVIHVK